VVGAHSGCKWEVVSGRVAVAGESEVENIEKTFLYYMYSLLWSSSGGRGGKTWVTTSEGSRKKNWGGD